jgi:hypothetical protein
MVLSGQPSASAVGGFHDLPAPWRALDLIRSYAHDCLHYATFRRYQLTGRGEIARVQYGINFRHPTGDTTPSPMTEAMARPGTWAS